MYKKEGFKVECDETCLSKKQEEKKLKELENEQLKKEEELRNQRELEMFQKKFNSKKRSKDRKQQEEIEEKSIVRQFWYVPVVITLLAVGAYVLL